MSVAKNMPVGQAWFITPATADQPCETVQTCAADVVVLDIEDSVAPSLKQIARERAERLFAQQAAGACALGIRINALTTVEGAQDLIALAQYAVKPPVILVPKVESARDVEIVAGCLDTAEYTPQIYALIETPRAVDTLSSIVQAERLSGLFFGAGDYAKLLGCEVSWEALLDARSRLAAGAAVAGLPALDAPFFDTQDLAGLRREAEKGRALGFSGKVAVHPRQLPVITTVFQPCGGQTAQARRHGGSCRPGMCVRSLR
ncbi:CoA ester lyase [Streptomyces scopuliridis]|uniref:CoA ester lyase n=1 Tax=Streptomyces scopuliridis TaxID=452529 RepID=A0ACD4ZBJ4_9ACTN|nr:CoA ester lyase [Streptomyces scopuliridis]WSB95592.1 CoA ester lyase [Streptomyces scopuliridis]WSC10699.1 CoA ester lyase [Streptomyces scopuliridis]